MSRSLIVVMLVAACSGSNGSAPTDGGHGSGTTDASGSNGSNGSDGSNGSNGSDSGPMNGHSFTRFTIDGVDGSIDENGDVIVALPLPLGADLTHLTPTFTIDGMSASPASGVAQDFTQPVAYTITGVDGLQYGNLARASDGFAAKVDFATGSYPGPIAVGDFNGDGKIDLAIGNASPASVSILLNTSTGGTTTFAPKVDVALGGSPASIVVADFDGDGKPDLAFPGSAGGDILINSTTTGSMTPTFTEATSGVGTFSNELRPPLMLAAADFNGDGMIDLAVADYNAGNANVMLNNTGSMDMIEPFDSVFSFAAGRGALNVAAADLDGDGKPDLVVSNTIDNTTSVLINTTTTNATVPTFAAAITLSAGGDVVATGDVNGDGTPDIVVAGVGKIFVIANTTTQAGSPTFATPTTFTTLSAGYLAVADLDGDGKPDIVTSGGYDWLAVLKNTTASGTLAFAPEVDCATDVLPQAVVIADFNGDGKPDLAAPVSSNTAVTNKVSVLTGE